MCCHDYVKEDIEMIQQNVQIAYGSDQTHLLDL